MILWVGRDDEMSSPSWSFGERSCRGVMLGESGWALGMGWEHGRRMATKTSLGCTRSERSSQLYVCVLGWMLTSR